MKMFAGGHCMVFDSLDAVYREEYCNHKVCKHICEYHVLPVESLDYLYERGDM